MARGLLLAFVVLAVVAALLVFRERSGEREPSPYEGANASVFDARNPFARVPGECAIVFDEGEAHLDADAIATAVLDGYDVRTKRAGSNDCRGRPLSHDPAELRAVTVLTSLVGGEQAALDDAGLSGSVFARIVFSESDAGCAAPKGLLALVTLRGQRLEIDALGEWTGSCGSIEPLAIADGGFVEPLEDSDDEDDGGAGQRRWLRIGSDLVMR